MEAAGRAVAHNVQARWPRQPIVVLCGPGNNGGDGFTAALHLAGAGWPVRVALLGSVEQLRGDAAHHAGLWQGKVEPFPLEVLDGAGAVIDAIFGAGLARPVEGAAAEMIEGVRVRKLPVCAVDVPSGLDGATGEIRGTAPQAEMTVTFFRKKPGHVLFPGRRLCGSIMWRILALPRKCWKISRPRPLKTDLSSGLRDTRGLSQGRINISVAMFWFWAATS